MPAPSNTTPGTAIDIGILVDDVPYSTTQDIYDSGTAYTVWYKYTAVDGDQTLGALAVGDLDSPIHGRYRPRLDIFSSFANATAGTPNILNTQDQCCQFQIDPPNTYYFKISPFLFFALNPAYGTILSFSVYRHIEEEIIPGSLIINDDGFGVRGLPASILDPVDGHVRKFQRSVPQSERLDICHQGNRILVDNSFDDNIKLYDLSFNLIATLPYEIATGAFANNRSNRFYIGLLGDIYAGPVVPATIHVVDLAGTAINTFTLPGAGSASYFTIGVNNAGTILYYTGTSDSYDDLGTYIKRWDIVNGINLSDLALGPTPGATVNYTLMVLADDTIVAIWSDYISGVIHTNLIHYQPDGTIINNHDLSSIILDDLGPRVCPAEDNLTAVWIWQRGGAEEIPNSTSGFKKIKISDGSVLASFNQAQFNNGINVSAISENPTDKWGHSESCFFAAFPPAGGRLIINKITNPSSDTTSFEFTSDLGDFSLAHGETQTFEGVASGNHSVIENLLTDYRTEYDPTNNEALTVVAGEDTVLNVTNTKLAKKLSGTYQLVPGKTNDTYHRQLDLGPGESEDTIDVKIPDPYIVVPTE